MLYVYGISEITKEFSISIVIWDRKWPGMLRTQVTSASNLKYLNTYNFDFTKLECIDVVEMTWS